MLWANTYFLPAWHGAVQRSVRNTPGATLSMPPKRMNRIIIQWLATSKPPQKDGERAENSSHWGDMPLLQQQQPNKFPCSLPIPCIVVSRQAWFHFWAGNPQFGRTRMMVHVRVWLESPEGVGPRRGMDQGQPGARNSNETLIAPELHLVSGKRLQGHLAPGVAAFPTPKHATWLLLSGDLIAVVVRNPGVIKGLFDGVYAKYASHELHYSRYPKDILL